MEYALQKTMKDYFPDIQPIPRRHTTIKRNACQTKKALISKKTYEFQLVKSQLIDMRRKVKRNFSFDRSIDLHGMTYDEAFNSVSCFLAKCQNEGVRTALIITGGNPLRTTVLRTAFQKWCKDFFGKLIVSCAPANMKHGGDGAFYVIIKSKRKK